MRSELNQNACLRIRNVLFEFILNWIKNGSELNRNLASVLHIFPNKSDQNLSGSVLIWPKMYCTWYMSNWINIFFNWIETANKLKLKILNETPNIYLIYIQINEVQFYCIWYEAKRFIIKLNPNMQNNQDWHLNQTASLQIKNVLY